MSSLNWIAVKDSRPLFTSRARLDSNGRCGLRDAGSNAGFLEDVVRRGPFAGGGVVEAEAADAKRACLIPEGAFHPLGLRNGFRVFAAVHDMLAVMMSGSGVDGARAPE